MPKTSAIERNKKRIRLVEKHAARREFVDYLGPRFGKELALELKASSLMLMPGALGLGVLDAFAAGLPVITAVGQGHGPELEYLESGVNSVIAEATPESLAAATRAGLCPSLRAGFEIACAESSQRISLTHMVERFADGISLAVGSGGSS
jgi:glycosyltransferase involved in cell wall biosynthesis